MPEKYIGQIVQIIYQDAKGKITQRTIRIRKIVDGKVFAYDLEKRAPRPFRMDRILSHFPVSFHAS
ncbi:WYL domain-containing protein [Cohnella mopanensis]|uniref:WYL domain-containing protein n=1 Tax=Cohnella mopanensis TaxID=2911966 RepID=UPI001EF90659|nr:WYL domain-containing protein [Cohnella mopanensis]